MVDSNPHTAFSSRTEPTQLRPEEYLVRLVRKIVEQKSSRSDGIISRTESPVKKALRRKALAKARKSWGSYKLAGGVPKEEHKARSRAHDGTLSPLTLANTIKEKGSISIDGVTVLPKDLFHAAKRIKNTPEKAQAVSYLLRLCQTEMVTSESLARNVGSLLDTLPDPTRGKLQEELKCLVIAALETKTRNDELFLFVNEVLPQFNFTTDFEEAIVSRLKVSRRVSEETVIGGKDELLSHLRRLKSYHLRYAIPVLKNIVVYLRLHLGNAQSSFSQDEVTLNRVIKASLKEAVSGIQGSIELYPLMRQILKDTFHLSSSLIEKIDSLCRIAEHEVNVSTHKGQDLLSPGDLRRVLERNHQRRPSGPGGTFDPMVTKALQELLTITEELSARGKGFLYNLDHIASDRQLQKEVERANSKFTRGDQLQALLDLTALREKLRPKIDLRMQEAYSQNQSSILRFGEHMRKAQVASQNAIELMERDIVLEGMIVDHCADVFNDLFANSRDTSGQETVTHVSNMLTALYIITQNALLSGLGNRNLGFFAHHIALMSQKNTYAPYDYAGAYGFVHQIRSLIAEIIQDLEEDYRPRAEAAIEKQRKRISERRAEALAFVQDLLRRTCIRQFGERFIVRVEDFLKELAQEQKAVEGFALDPALRKDVASVANFISPGASPSAAALKECSGLGPHVIGTKAHGLGTIIGLGLPVPDGFVVIADRTKTTLSARLKGEVKRELQALEERTGKKIGGSTNPLIFSMRSSFPVSMPGVFPTVTNAGMNKAVLEALGKAYDRRFALECYVRFVRSFCDTMIDTKYPIDYVAIPKDVSIDELLHFLDFYGGLASEAGIPVPDDPWQQVANIAERIMYQYIPENVYFTCAVHGIPSNWRLSVIVQEMVFGNLDNSYTAVVYTRDTRDGSPKMEAEVLHGRQGEDLVARKRTLEVQDVLPETDDAFLKRCRPALEREFGSTEIELTNQQGRTFFLQARSARLNPQAAQRAVRDMVAQGILTSGQAKAGLSEKDTTLPRVDPSEKPLCKGIRVSGGAITASIALSIETALKHTEEGKKAILILEYTPGREMRDRYPHDIGVLTAHGGTAQHYAAWCRSMGRPYVTMVEDMRIDLDNGLVRLGPKVLMEGDEATIDGTTGNIYQGSPKLIVPSEEDDVTKSPSTTRQKSNGLDIDQDISPFIGTTL